MIHLDNVRLREYLQALSSPSRMALAAASKAHRACTRLFLARNPSTLLIMPAWQRGGDIGIKMVTVDARRSRQGGEAVNGVYVLLDGAYGAVSALLDARVLTASHTAAVSALASSPAGAEGCFDAADGRHGKPRSVPGADAPVSSELQQHSGVGTRLRKGPGIGSATADLERGRDMRGCKRSGSSGRECRHCVLRDREHCAPGAWQGCCSRNARGPYRQLHTGDARGG